jgi:hypothetical protein
LRCDARTNQPELARRAGGQAEYLILVDNASGDFLRPALSAPLPLTTEGAAAALLALLDAPPMTLNDVDVHAQVDSLLASNPFARPQAVFSLNVLGADDTGVPLPPADTTAPVAERDGYTNTSRERPRRRQLIEQPVGSLEKKPLIW